MIVSRSWVITTADNSDATSTYEIACPAEWTEQTISDYINSNSSLPFFGGGSFRFGASEFVVSVKKKRGGARPNSGRSKGSPTKAVRVSQELANNIDKVQALLALVADWQARQIDEPASDTSPRWERMNEFLEEVKGIGL